MQHHHFGSAILGSGVYIPKRIVTSEELGQTLRLEPGFIEAKTGVSERRLCGPQENVITMAVEAARLAVRDAGVERLTHIVIARDLYITEHGPSIALHVLGALRADGVDVHGCTASDITNYCLGAANALDTASMLVETGRAETALIVASADYTSIVHETWDHSFEKSRQVPLSAVLWSLAGGEFFQAPRHNMCLWGCGAGALMVGRSDESRISPLRSQLSETVLRDSFGFCVLPDGRTIASIDGRSIAKFAEDELPGFLTRYLSSIGATIADFDAIVPHQANALLLRTLFETMNVPLEKVVITCDTLGNLGCASIPVAYHLSRTDGRIQGGARVLFLPFGDTQLTLGAMEVRA